MLTIVMTPCFGFDHIICMCLDIVQHQIGVKLIRRLCVNVCVIDQGVTNFVYAARKCGSRQLEDGRDSGDIESL